MKKQTIALISSSLLFISILVTGKTLYSHTNLSTTKIPFSKNSPSKEEENIMRSIHDEGFTKVFSSFIYEGGTGILYGEKGYITITSATEDMHQIVLKFKDFKNNGIVTNGFCNFTVSVTKANKNQNSAHTYTGHGIGLLTLSGKYQKEISVKISFQENSVNQLAIQYQVDDKTIARHIPMTSLLFAQTMKAFCKEIEAQHTNSTQKMKTKQIIYGQRGGNIEIKTLYNTTSLPYKQIEIISFNNYNQEGIILNGEHRYSAYVDKTGRIIDKQNTENRKHEEAISTIHISGQRQSEVKLSVALSQNDGKRQRTAHCTIEGIEHTFHF